MAIYVAKDTGVQAIARQPASQDSDQFVMWLLSHGVDAEVLDLSDPYSWVVLAAGDVRVLSDDDFDDLYEEAPTDGQGG